MFTVHASKYQPYSSFYAISHDLVKNDFNVPNETAIFVYKEDDVYLFEGIVLINFKLFLLIIQLPNFYNLY